MEVNDVQANVGKTLSMKSNFQLNPEAAIFLPSQKYLIIDSQKSTLLLPSPPPSNNCVDEPKDKDDKAEKAKKKAERKAQFEAERAAKLKQQNSDSTQESEKSKAEKRAERRALQESQRAVKEAQKTIKTKSQTQIKEAQVAKEEKQIVNTKPTTTNKGKKVHFLSHLRQYKPDKPLLNLPPFARCDLHPSMLRLGLQFASGTICGSNARCVAFLHALKQMIIDYVTPSNKELSRDLDDKLDIQIQFLQECRPISVSIENAVKFFKRRLTEVTRTTSDSNIKKTLLEAVETYIKDNILCADKTIAELAMEKIKDDDVILIFAHSSVVMTVLKRARSEGTRFRVIIVDSRPKLEGLKTKTILIKQGIECTYTLINAISYAMLKVTKVFLGAHALLANGYVMSRVGTAQVALVAKAYNVPVLVCCETHKFTDKVQIDSFVYNELGNPEDLVRTTNSNQLLNWQDLPNLDILHLVYDVTPPDLISAVITDLGMLPCTSVPVVLRLKLTK